MNRSAQPAGFPTTHWSRVADAVGSISKQAGQLSYEELATRTGTTEAAVQQAAQRLRKRYKAILRARIAATLDDSDEAAINDEIRDLFTALAN